MKIEEIEGLIESYVGEIELCEQSVITGCDDLEHAYNMGSIKDAYEALIEAIKQYREEKCGVCKE